MKRHFVTRKNGAWLYVLTLLIMGAWLLRGAGHEAVETLSWVVVNKTIILDPGHGGIDPGAVGPGGTLEKDVTLAIAKRLERFFDQAGAEVIMTRYTDEDLSSPGKSLAARKREDLEKRLRMVTEKEGMIYISIQANAFGTQWTGAQTFYHPRSGDGEVLAKTIQKEIRSQLKNTKREARPLDPFMLRHLEIPGAMVEVGFLSNPQEERMLGDDEYQTLLAWAIYSGVVRYLAEN